MSEAYVISLYSKGFKAEGEVPYARRPILSRDAKGNPLIPYGHDERGHGLQALFVYYILSYFHLFQSPKTGYSYPDLPILSPEFACLLILAWFSTRLYQPCEPLSYELKNRTKPGFDR